MTSADSEKLRERRIFLKRFYWLEDLHKIGTELSINDIMKVSSYWDLNHDKAAQQVAERLDDQGLLYLVSRNPPKYITLGGFQGQFYSMDEEKRFSLSSSRDNVVKNVRKSLDKWGNRAYGVLQALINKNGKSNYVDLINEIENVLGKEYAPSILLPRLESLKLVFKAGSNKYPYWTIPEEIIPVVKEELGKFKLQDSSEPRKIKTYSQRMSRNEEIKLLTRDLRIDNVVEDLVNRKSEINMIFQDKFKCKFFRDNERAVMRLMKPCSDEDDFASRIQWLSVVINEDIETNELRKIIPAESGKLATPNVISALLEKYGIPYEDNLVKNLKMLKILRNKKYPTHPDHREFMEGVRYFGQISFPPDWTTLWETVLKAVTESLTVLRDKLQMIHH